MAWKAGRRLLEGREDPAPLLGRQPDDPRAEDQRGLQLVPERAVQAGSQVAHDPIVDIDPAEQHVPIFLRFPPPP
jgi:hypothetical protein